MQTINVGTNPDDGTGDTLRAAFQKINANLTNVITIPSVNADINDYAPSGDPTIIRVDCQTFDVNFTGMVPATGFRILINVGSEQLNIAPESSNSSAANRILTNYGYPINLMGGGAVLFWYDTASSRWRAFSMV